MKKDYSKALIALTIVLLGIGLLVLFSASAVIAQKEHQDVFYYLKKQIVQGILLGTILGFIASKLPLSFWRKLAPFFLILNILLIGLCFVPPFKVTTAHALRWLKLGPIVFQPSEFFKITYFAFLAGVLSNSTLKERTKIFGKPFLIYLISLGLISGLMFIQPSTGTVIIIAFSSLIVYFISGLSFRQFLFLFIIGILVLYYVVKITPYRLERIISFTKGEEDPLKSGYHINQSLIGIGSGGILGKGFLKSVQKFFYLPEAHTDSVFSVMAEEFGFIGSLILIVLYLILIGIGFKIASQALNAFNRYFATGLVSSLAFQAFINMAVMVKLVPATGVPLPFISYGSSSLIVSLIIIGILTKISSVES